MDFTLILIFILIVIILYFVFNKITKGDGITGLIDATKESIIPNKDMGITEKSVPAGNYAYSVWTYVNDWSYRYGETKSIIRKDDLEIFFAPTQNDLVVKVPTSDPSDSEGNTTYFECGVSNIPIQRWVNIIVSFYGKTIDIYINGKLVKTCVLVNNPILKLGTNVSLTGAGGFAGFTSKFNYIAESMTPQNAWTIYQKGWSEKNLLSINSGYDVDVVVTKNGEIIY